MITREQAVAALAHFYAATTTPNYIGSPAPEFPPSLNDYLGALGGRERVEVITEADRWSRRIVDDFRRTHIRAALLIAGDR